MEYEKVYVGVWVYTDPDGNSKPAKLLWNDGRQFEIGKVVKRSIAAPEHVGSTPTVRYDVIIDGHEKKLYYEKFTKKWFVVKQNA